MGEINSLALNELLSRSNFLTRILSNDNPQRDIDRECQYPSTNALDVQTHYFPFYDRHPIARRVVELYPQECWASSPRIYETEDNEHETEFEKAWDELGSKLNGGSKFKSQEGSVIWEYLKRVDIQCGIGYYGCLFLGFNDVENSTTLSEPVVAREGLELLFMRAFNQKDLQVTTWDNDESSERFGFPEKYLVTFSAPTNANEGGTTLEIQREVHWTRIIHVADNIGGNEIIGTPRMQPVYNNLLDLKKLYGGSAEGYWAGAFPGISFETLPQLGAEVQVDSEALQNMVEKYLHRLQRYFALEGMTAKSLNTQVEDPTKHIDAQLNAICIQLGCPKRIFTGSERGELASSQDTGSWKDRLIERQNSFITPRIIRVFIDRLIDLKVLPEPEEYMVEWPDLNALSDDEKATIALKRVESIVKFIAGDGEQLMSRVDFYVHILDMTPEQAEQLIETADDNIEEDVLEGEFSVEDQDGVDDTETVSEGEEEDEKTTQRGEEEKQEQDKDDRK